MKHTPGPWIVCGPTIQSAPTDSAPAGYALAHVLNPYAGATGSAARVYANAALIAAAPAMLEALQAIVCHEQGLQKFRLEKALAAIRAATGE